EASQRALEAASDTVHPQGIVASFPIQDPAITTSSEGRALCLICDRVQDPGNLGTILRSAEAAGATGVWLSEGCADVHNPKVVRAAMGAHFRLPIFSEAKWDSLATELAGRSVELTRVFATEAGADDWYDQVDWAGPAALIVSNEAHGLSDQARNMAGNLISIPMVGGAESLNAAVAASIVLFEAARQRRTLSTLLQGGTSSE
ncbi:MAG TPA: RNA methyltransferase, partial [Chloroflexia bacterium]|nr:RNA methyltransferase [Chloroflexia bacterium]